VKLDAGRTGRAELTQDAAPQLGIGLNPVQIQIQEPIVNRCVPGREVWLTFALIRPNFPAWTGAASC
jgi:hypothetical protein